jgi:nucleoside-diphosphate-sugar epimerase
MSYCSGVKLSCRISPMTRFVFFKANVWEPRAILNTGSSDWPRPRAIIHLAAIVGFPACQAIGRQWPGGIMWKPLKGYLNKLLNWVVERFIYASTYSNYGLSPNGAPVTEESPLNPQSLYAETKISAERYLLAQVDSPCAPLVFRLATLFGLSPRTRFDLIVNQFVLDAFTKRELLIYQRGYSRSFLHIRDAIHGIILGLRAEEKLIRGQVYNLGCDQGNYTKDEIVAIILKRLPETVVTYKDMTFGGDMRDISVSFQKIRSELGF